MLDSLLIEDIFCKSRLDSPLWLKPSVVQVTAGAAEKKQTALRGKITVKKLFHKILG